MRKPMTEKEKRAFVKRMAAARKAKSGKTARRRNPAPLAEYIVIAYGPGDKVGYWTGNNFNTLKSKSKKYLKRDADYIKSRMKLPRGWFSEVKKR